MLLCQYKNIFGEPRKGVHSIRLFDFAIVDIILTIFVALFIAYIFKTSFLFTLLFLFIVGELLHILFCVETKFVNMLGIKFQ